MELFIEFPEFKALSKIESAVYPYNNLQKLS
jgi:hypothetical protein